MIICDSEEHLKILRQFQEKVSDLNQDENTCMRFLVARDFSISKAEEMIRNNQIWRKTNEIDRIQEWKVAEDLAKGFPFEILSGMSKNQCPVIWAPVGIWEGRYYVEQGRKDDMIRYGFAMLERILIKLKETGNKRMVVIADLKGLTYHKMAHLGTLRVNHTLFQAFEQNYPETLEKCIVLNAPWVYTIGYNFVKPILAPKTKAKLEVYGSDKTLWLPALRNICEDETLPKEYLIDNI